jgi:hypothetical protein
MVSNVCPFIFFAPTGSVLLLQARVRIAALPVFVLISPGYSHFYAVTGSNRPNICYNSFFMHH